MLTFLKEFPFDGRRRFILVRCDCGVEKEVEWTDWRNNHTKSCGCRRKVGRSHKLYKVWHGMKARCNNPKSVYYQYYGGRGVFVCKEWLSYDVFYKDNINRYKEGLELDRFPNADGEYSLANTRWVTHAENMRNSRQAKLNVELAEIIRNSSATIFELAKMFNIDESQIRKIKKREAWIA